MVQTSKKSVKSAEKFFYADQMKEVTIKKNKFYPKDTTLELHENLAQKLVDAGKAYWPGEKTEEEPSLSPDDETQKQKDPDPSAFNL
ncbi:MAG TPA: hypothetical protein VHA52_08745 [Candidatus Babeliaceae bacterium]|nr:hypothetical protein [Candidatus Babeliaceae bacterium]